MKECKHKFVHIEQKINVLPFMTNSKIIIYCENCGEIKKVNYL